MFLLQIMDKTQKLSDDEMKKDCETFALLD